jgi:DNA invertase Pin-like site-specific DNA recombinase
VTLLEDLQAVGVSFVSLGEGIDCTTPAGKLQLRILAALAEFERERIREKRSGTARLYQFEKQFGASLVMRLTVSQYMHRIDRRRAGAVERLRPRNFRKHTVIDHSGQSRILSLHH